jgi:hypothetical protein
MPDDAREVIFPQGVPIVQLGGAAERTAKAIADRDLRETAEEGAAEPDNTAQEDNLSNEQDEVEVVAAKAELDAREEDLLSDKD